MKKNKDKIENYEDNKLQVRKAVDELVNKTIENMPTLIEQKKKQFVEKLLEVGNLVLNEDFENKKRGSNSLIVSNLLFEPISPYFIGRPLYTAEKLALVFDLYREMITECNVRGLKVVPTKSHFSRFCGFSTNTYDCYSESTDLAMRNLIEVISDYLFDSNITSAQHRELELATTIFRTRVEQNKVEPTAPQIHVISPDADMEKIMDDIKRIKEGNRRVIDVDIVEDDNRKHNEPKRINKK